MTIAICCPPHDPARPLCSRGRAKTLPGTRAGSCGGFSASGPHLNKANCNATIANHLHIDR